MNGPYKVETPLGTGRSYVLNGAAHRIQAFDCTADAESFCKQMNEAYRAGTADSQKCSENEWTKEFPTEEGCFWVFDTRNASDVNSGLYLIRIKGAGNKQWIEHMGTAAVTTHEDIEEYKKRDLLYIRIDYPHPPSQSSS
ncbi:MAG: hypothetical protein NPIRA04_32870 [Nitrospirales bacterium]|nr:MAG: hypothetical protein NPIRA04_32870 [Nitrospirales bacterium]